MKSVGKREQIQIGGYEEMKNLKREDSAIYAKIKRTTATKTDGNSKNQVLI